MIAFWVLAPIMVICAASAWSSSARRSTRPCCSRSSWSRWRCMYAVQDAPFLFAVQIIVYTGAVLMLFLFVLMLVGVDSADSLVETHPRPAGRGGGRRCPLRGPADPRHHPVHARRGRRASVQANRDGNVSGLAQLLFSRYVFAFEVTSALLITAALGAMVLAHRERLTPKPTQRDLVLQRMREYASRRHPPGPAADLGDVRPAQLGRHTRAAA